MNCKKIKHTARELILACLMISMAGLTVNIDAGTFRAGKETFLLDGEPYIIKAAELHYPRIPKEYWDQRIKLSKALGMNTICLYTFWNSHEPKEGEFDFTGQNDLREFVKLCEENEMKVILRPGPYVCAEWEMGGLPWWLLKKKDIRLREKDPYFMEKVEAFQDAVAKQVGDLTITDGGPIIMVQVENEYGSYGEDKDYISAIRDILRDKFGDEILMFQCDWSSNFMVNGLDDLLWTINFGTGADIDSQFEPLKNVRPETPLMCSEFWSGWFDKWGAAHETRPADDMVEGIDEMLSKNISFSLYMTHGGTNWSHWAGANSPGYSPDVTSYDYDAPISESGIPTEKYWKLRNTLAKYLPEGDTLPPLPPLIEPIEISRFPLTEFAPLNENLREPIADKEIKTMEEYDMGFGSIIYSTALPAVKKGEELIVSDPHDFAQVFIDGELIGTLDRRKGEFKLTFPDAPEGARLDILVEAMGRINFGRAIKDYKGITGKVSLASNEGVEDLHDWKVYLLPDEKDFYDSMTFRPVEYETQGERLPRGVYRGTFNVDKPSDTFLNFESWGKGLVYVNGHGIGRIWNIGPQQTLYMPGAWLREGENEILVFDIIGPTSPETEGFTAPVIDKLNIDQFEKDVKKIDFKQSVGETYAFENGNGWKQILFDDKKEGRYIGLEIIDTYDNSEPAIAELYLLDENGDRLPRENWKGKAGSEKTSEGNHTVDKIFDLQESTYWTPEPGEKENLRILLDLGSDNTVSGIQYLPRMETNAPGAIKNIRIYVFQ